MNRPFTDPDSIKKNFLLEFEKQLGGAALTCRLTGIPKQTYHYWLEHDADFKEARDEIISQIHDKIEGSLMRDAVRKGGTDRMFYMKKKMKDRGYSDDPMVTNIHNYNIDDMDKDALIRVGKQLEKKESVDDNDSGTAGNPVSVQESSE